MTNSFEDLMKIVKIAESLAAIAARILSERKALSTEKFKIKIGIMMMIVLICEEMRGEEKW